MSSIAALPAISPVVKPANKLAPGAPKKNSGTMYPLPALAAAKVEGVVKNLDNEFILALPLPTPLPQIVVPKLALPDGKFIEPEDIEKLPPVEPEDEELYADWYERQVKEFKEDMREEARWK